MVQYSETQKEMEIRGVCTIKKSGEQSLIEIEATANLQLVVLNNNQKIQVKIKGTQTSSTYTGTEMTLTGDIILLSDFL